MLVYDVTVPGALLARPIQTGNISRFASGMAAEYASVSDARLAAEVLVYGLVAPERCLGT